jgi:hypothetical protein
VPVARPIPDWRTICPDCGERVGYDAGVLRTVHELNALARAATPEAQVQHWRERAEWFADTLKLATAEVERLREVLHDIIAYEVQDEDGHLDALAMQDRARDALNAS